jgi:23S rRNA (pseudouridine1915-N3)-methyltransferase
VGLSLLLWRSCRRAAVADEVLLKIVIGAIGRLKTGPEKEMAAEYESRILATGRGAGVTGFAIKDWAESRAADADRRKAEEAQLLLPLSEGAKTVVLDERGKALSSVAFAEWLKRVADGGAKQVTFLIGGPDGHGDEVRAKADLLMSFGPATFPHRLIRVMLLEQVYRALTILTHHPYHRS